MRIAYPGSTGSYTEEAAARLYPDDERIAFADFEEVARAADSATGRFLAPLLSRRPRAPIR